MSRGLGALESGWSMSPATVTTRLFEGPDLRALYAIEEACFNPPLRFSRALMRSVAHDPECRTWLSVVDNIRAGFAIVSVRGQDSLPDTATDSASAYIWTIEVLPAYRRIGVARQLLRCLEESAREAGCEAIELHVSELNKHALALYEGAGFVPCGIERDYYGPDAHGIQYRKRF